MLPMNHAIEEVDYSQYSEEEQAELEHAFKMEKLAKLSSALSKSREEAISHRAASGIEEDWLEDEEFYEGIDDANRAQLSTRQKPIGYGGQTNHVPAPTRSTVFMNITRPYVDAASAKISDMLLPTDEQNWGLNPTPVPDLIKAQDDASPLINGQGQPMMHEVADPETGGMVKKQMTVADHVKKVLDEAKEKAKAAEKRIDDWLQECQYNTHIRSVIEDAARIGSGIIKGPVPLSRKRKAVKRHPSGLVSIEMKTEVVPESRHVSPWNLYPDPACGNDIHKGTYIWERDTITKKEIVSLKEDPSYIVENLLQVLEEGPATSRVSDGAVDKGGISSGSKNRYDIWYYYGMLDKDDLEAAGCDPEGQEVAHVLVTMINDLVIKAAINPLDSGEFPYDVMVWQKRQDFWAGVGVARQMNVAQRGINAATRNMMDNAGLSAGPQIIVRRKNVEPADGSWAITPRKMWYVLEGDDGRPASDFISSINIESRQAELMGIIQMYEKKAEDVTGLPMLLQGQQGAAPDTVGGMQMLNNNASSVMRRLARTFDDRVTENHIGRYYEWLLLFGKDDNEKGDFNIIARGSSALVERDIQNQVIAQMASIVANPIFGADPRRWFREWLKSQRIDPDSIQFTDEQWEEMQQKAAEQAKNNPPPEAMRAQATLQGIQLRTEADLQKSQANTELSKEELRIKQQEAQRQRDHELQMAILQRDTKILEISSQQRMSVEKVKAQLAGVALKAKNDREIYQDEAQLRRDTGAGV